MDLILLFAISIIPAILLFLYFDRQDRGMPEPRKLKWLAFRWGVYITLVAAFIEYFVDSFIYETTENYWIRVFLSAFVTAALIEEGAKLWVVRKKVFDNPHFNEVMDGITYMIIVSLGFATLENIFYVFEGGLLIGILRAILSVPGHALYSGVMGYYIGVAKFAQDPTKRRNLFLKGLGWGVFYHGVYDLFLLSESMLAVLVIPLVIIMFIQLRQKIQWAWYKEGVQKEEPTAWGLKRYFKVGAGLIFFTLGTVSVLGTGLLLFEGMDVISLLGSIIFTVFLFVMSHLLLKGNFKMRGLEKIPVKT